MEITETLLIVPFILSMTVDSNENETLDKAHTCGSAISGPLGRWFTVIPPAPRAGPPVARRPPHNTLDSLPMSIPRTFRVCLTMQEKLNVCLSELDTKKLSEKYRISLRTVRSIKSNGASFYQSRINRGLKGRKRQRGFNKERKAILKKVHLKLLQEFNGKHAVTKVFVVSVMETYGIQLQDFADETKERIYKRFKRLFGWINQRFGRVHYVGPSDVGSRIRAWARQLYIQNQVRSYAYVIFGDETSLPVDGENTRVTLAPIGLRNVQVVTTNDKESITVFPSGVYDVHNRKALPLPPTVLFKSNAEDEKSRILRDARHHVARTLDNALKVYVTSIGWMNRQVFEEIVHDQASLLGGSQPATALVVDEYTGSSNIGFIESPLIVSSTEYLGVVLISFKYTIFGLLYS